MEAGRKSEPHERDILALFPTPLYTSTGLYFEEDLREMGLGEVLREFSLSLQEKIRRHAVTLAGTQPELGLRFLMKAGEIAALLDEKELDQWVLSLLDIYDAGGLNPALQYIEGLKDNPEFRLVVRNATTFEEVAGILQHYLHGLGKRGLRLEKGETVHTDTEVLYVPARIDAFQDRDRHFLLYKIMITYLFYQVHLRSYRLPWSSITSLVRTLRNRYGLREEETYLSDLSRFFSLFPDPVLARDIYMLVDTARIESRVRRDLPGLYRKMRDIKKALLARRPPPPGEGLKSGAVEETVRWWLDFSPGRGARTAKSPGTETLPGLFQGVLSRVFADDSDLESPAAATAEIYRAFGKLPGPYAGMVPVFYAGELRPEEAEKTRRRRRESVRAEFREELSKLVAELPECETVKIEVAEKEAACAGEQPSLPRELPDHLLIDGRAVPVPEAMKKLIEEIYEDLGTFPNAYLAVANEMSGHHFRPLCRMPAGTGYFLSPDAEDVHVLDEWDFRRKGFRRNWVLMREMEIEEEDAVFLEETLARYSGMIRRIRQQFERIRLEQKILKRQKEGDGIDLDAVVEAFADLHAGHQPSERVFTRLRRDTRNVASVFLLDLSGSTTGWINEMERATLLILSEALRVLGDKSAIYGFSGQTRKRCELYRIKEFTEQYNTAIQRRIGGLQAREWTRMGPPIRHVSRLLQDEEARTKLLITLSDGKPDDYDAYKGEYAVEDTRHALIEARNRGIHSFCITIDKAEHSYLQHMYGRGNYIFINDLSLLPVKVPEIYRKLTT
jgi:nitric oxide reductase NorD protein